MKAMFSVPLAGKIDKEIIETRNRAIQHLTELGYDIVNENFDSNWYSPENMKKRGVVNIGMAYFSKSIEQMTQCQVAYFCKGWEKATGCKLEHEVAKAYGLIVLYEE